MEYDITQIHWHVYITVKPDLTFMWIATPPLEDEFQINMACSGYFDKENPQNGAEKAKEGWKEYATDNVITDYEIEIVKGKEKKLNVPL